jgi:DNA-binding response OmpR family regulator
MAVRQVSTENGTFPRPGLPVFMISAYGDADTVSTVRERGADEFLTKPVDSAKLRRDIMTVRTDAMRGNT